MKKPAYVIFDMDGLMFNTEALGERCMRTVLAQHGYTLTHEFYLKMVGSSGKITRAMQFAEFGEDYPHDLLARQTRDLMQSEIKTHGLEIKPGLMELLAFLKQEKIPCCVASSTRHAGVENYLQIAGIQDYFQFIVGGDEVNLSKPNPDIFLKALEKAKVSSSDALVLEDSINGIKASRAAAIPVICVPDMVMPPKDIRAHCLCLVDSLDHVITLLK